MSDFRKLLLLLVASVALRCAMAILLPMLAGESYYWLWGQYPDAGYFDHPPMVGLQSWLCFGWVLASPLAARSSAIIFGLLTILALYGFVRDMFGDSRLAWRVAALYALTPIFILLGVALMPDNGLLLFSTLTWWMFWRATRDGGLKWWILAGLAAGLALLSKFHAWILLPPLWGFLVLSPRRRPLLKSWGPWLSAILALLVVSPNLFWNSQREWLNYGFQWSRSNLPESHFTLANPAIFLAGVVCSLSPWVCVAALSGIRRAWGGRAKDDRLLFLLCAGLPLPLFLGLLSLGVRISFHWPSCGYIPLLILSLHAIQPSLAKWTWRSVSVLAVIVYLAPLWLLALPRVPELEGQQNALVSVARLRKHMTGLREVSEHARRLRDEAQETAPTVIMARNWHLTSTLAFHSGLPRECFAFSAPGAHNYELWRQDRGGLATYNAIVVIEKDHLNKKHKHLTAKYDKYLSSLEPLFETVQPLPSLMFYADGSMEEVLAAQRDRPRVREFMFFHCKGFRGVLKDQEASSHLSTDTAPMIHE